MLSCHIPVVLCLELTELWLHLALGLQRAAMEQRHMRTQLLCLGTSIVLE